MLQESTDSGSIKADAESSLFFSDEISISLALSWSPTTLIGHRPANGENTRARQINRNSNAERNVIQKYSAGMHVDKNIHTQTGENKPADVNIRSASCSVSPS